MTFRFVLVTASADLLIRVWAPVASVSSCCRPTFSRRSGLRKSWTGYFSWNRPVGLEYCQSGTRSRRTRWRASVQRWPTNLPSTLRPKAWTRLLPTLWRLSEIDRMLSPGHGRPVAPGSPLARSALCGHSPVVVACPELSKVAGRQASLLVVGRDRYRC